MLRKQGMYQQEKMKDLAGLENRRGLVLIRFTF